jgi:WD40 repeat protein
MEKSKMKRAFGVVFLLSVAGGIAAQEPKPFTLDKINPAKVPAALRPAKGLPKEVIAALGQRGDKVDCLAFRPDGKVLAISGADQFLRFWNLDGLRPIASPRQPDSVVCLTYSADGKRLAVGDARGVVRVFDRAETFAPVPKFVIPAHKDGPVWSVAFSPNGKTLATGGRDKAVRLWNLSKVKPVGVTLDGHEAGVQSVVFDVDGKWLFSAGGADEQLRVWDLTTEKPKAGEVVKPGGKVVRLAVSADGTQLVTAGQKIATKLWSLKAGKLADAVALESDRPVSSISFAPSGELVAGVILHSETEDRVFVWGKDGKKKHEFAFDLHLHAVSFAPDGQHLAVVTEVQTLLVRLPK